jgi:hypothetical protein
VSGYVFVLTECAACRRTITCNPHRVPSLRREPSGPKLPICRSCFDKWNEIHRTSKGLEPMPIHPDAYEPIPETEL